MNAKIKHFEDLWEESEEFSKENRAKNTEEDLINKILTELETIKNTKNELYKAESFGLLLFELSALSYKLNINVYAALKAAIEDLKIEHYEISNND